MVLLLAPTYKSNGNRQFKGENIMIRMIPRLDAADRPCFGLWRTGKVGRAQVVVLWGGCFCQKFVLIRGCQADPGRQGYHYYGGESHQSEDSYGPR